MRAGAVRSEHYAGVGVRGGYRNPYSDEYFRHFRPGYRPFLLDGAQYYGYDSLPLGYQQVVLNGITYYLLRWRVLPAVHLRGANGVYGGPGTGVIRTPP